VLDNALCIMHNGLMLKLYMPKGQPWVRKTDYVMESIRTAILLGKVPPGTAITEQQVKDLLNVSSSPVREALNQLEAEGLLIRNPHVGTKVAEIDVDDAKEIYSIQTLLQSTAVQICTKKLKDEDIREAEKLNGQMIKLTNRKTDVNHLKILNYKFHMIVCGKNVYPWLTKLISALWVRLPRETVWVIPKEPKAAVRFHDQIIHALISRDGRRAASAMREHLERSRKVLFD
jgi:DNA-binding GntR family transcriptional regulator